MGKIDLSPLSDIDGYLAACLVDSSNGMMLGSDGRGIDLDLAAAGNTDVVRAKRKVMGALKLDDKIEDILISLGKQYHLIRPLDSNPEFFLYVVLDRTRANLAMARLRLRNFEQEMK